MAPLMRADENRSTSQCVWRRMTSEAVVVPQQAFVSRHTHGLFQGVWSQLMTRCVCLISGGKQELRLSSQEPAVGGSAESIISIGIG